LLEKALRLVATFSIAFCVDATNLGGLNALNAFERRRYAT
jgi:hypothetical protein